MLNVFIFRRNDYRLEKYYLPKFKREMSGEPCECPLCLEELDVDDLSFYPCPCGYQVPQSSSLSYLQ